MWAAIQTFLALCFVAAGLMAVANVCVQHGADPRPAYGLAGVIVGFLAARRP